MRAIGQSLRTPRQGCRQSVPYYNRSRPICRFSQTQQLPGLDGRLVQPLPNGGSIIFHWDPLTLTLSTVTVSTPPPAAAVDASSNGNVLSGTKADAMGASIGVEATSSAAAAPAVASTSSAAAAPTATATSSSPPVVTAPSSSSPPIAKATPATTRSPRGASAARPSSKPAHIPTPTLPDGSIDWEARRKLRTAQEVQELASRRGIPCTLDAVMSGLQQLEDLVPGFKVNLESLKAVDWARLALDPKAAAAALVALKAAYPGADMCAVVTMKPGLLLQTPEQLAANAAQVRSLFATAVNLDALITALPMLTDPAVAISILVTVKKWYHTKPDPVAVLEADPDLVLRAESCDETFEPVYVDQKTGSWMAPSLANYKEKRADWQAYIEKNVYKNDDGMPGSG